MNWYDTSEVDKKNNRLINYKFLYWIKQGAFAYDKVVLSPNF